MKPVSDPQPPVADRGIEGLVSWLIGASLLTMGLFLPPACPARQVVSVRCLTVMPAIWPANRAKLCQLANRQPHRGSGTLQAAGESAAGESGGEQDEHDLQMGSRR